MIQKAFAIGRGRSVQIAAVKVTVSAGVARSENGEQDPAHVIRRADENLYRAKNAGRDRVCAATTTGDSTPRLEAREDA
jgi:diguanylate cyclase (GGDEF)-like protein